MAWDSAGAFPVARRDDLIVRSTGDEMLIYDLRTDDAHCLHPLAAAIWSGADGVRSVAALASEAGCTPEAALLAVRELEDRGLLECSGVATEAMSRRDLFVRAGLGAVVALPLITSIVVPTAAQAGSLGGSGAPCTASAQCASGLCNTTTNTCA